MKIKEITIVFENCEWITVAGENVESFIANNITETMHCFEGNVIWNNKTSDNIVMILNKNTCLGKESFTKSVYDRITEYNDITSFEIKYEDNSISEIYVIWTGDDEEDNAAQSSGIVDGKLYLLIDKDNKFDGYFDYIFDGVEDIKEDSSTDESFLSKITKLLLKDDIAEIRDFLKENGIDITNMETYNAIKAIADIVHKEGELNEN